MLSLVRAGLIALALFAAPLAHAQCTAPPLTDRFSPAQTAALRAAADETPYATGLAWRATRAGREITLIGTMHLADDRHDALLAAMAPTIAAADLVMLELTAEDEREMQRAMADDPSMAFITEGPTLPDLLPEPVWQDLADAARARSVPAFIAAKSQPWFLMATLALPPCAMADLLSGARGLDHMIMEHAAASGVPMQALEPWDTLPRIFGSIAFDQQIALLSFVTLDDQIQAEAHTAMLDSYFAGRVGEIMEMSRIGAELVEGLDDAAAEEAMALTEELLMTGRNNDWMPRILAASEAHPRLIVAAGAAHLPGQTGLLQHLENAGWQIAPIPGTPGAPD